MLTDWLRWYVIAVGALAALIGTPQWPRIWRDGNPQDVMAWLALAALNLAVVLGTVEGLVRGLPGGPRNWLISVAMTWLLAAVAYHPARQGWRWWLRRRAMRTRPREER